MSSRSPADPSAAWRAALTHLTSLAQGPPLDPTIAINVHFHPDQDTNGRALLEQLVDEGIYRSQFETGTSNGGLTAHPGGDRWLWESRLFGGAHDNLPASRRPKYGSLNHRHRLAGASVRFGSAHLRLRPHVLERTTFCYPIATCTPQPSAPLATCR